MSIGRLLQGDDSYNVAVGTAARVLSLGYEGRSIEDFVAILVTAGVRKLIDVREVALSRRAEYRKASLERSLSRVGIEYQHLREAGNPYRDGKANLERCLGAYRRYLERNPEVIDSIADLIKDAPTAVLCYEREHSACHRSVLLGALIQEGHRVELVAVE